MKYPLALILPISLGLAACEKEADTPAPAEDDAGRGAAGEVLGGTVSDEMLPLERIQSQAPMLEEEPEEGEGKDPKERPKGAASSAEPTATTVPASTPEPVPSSEESESAEGGEEGATNEEADN